MYAPKGKIEKPNGINSKLMAYFFLFLYFVLLSKI
jgi:hypothetical protein